MHLVRLAGVFVLSLAIGQVASAGPITLQVGATGDYILGEVIPPLGGQSGGQAERDALAINTLRGMTVPSTVTPYYRSSNVFGPLPIATTTNALLSGKMTDGDPVTITLSSRIYDYLAATYDGKNAGTQVWYIGNLPSGTELVFPRYAAPVAGHLVGKTEGDYKISHWTLLNPTAVPDGGSVAMLLGISLLGLAGLRRIVG